MSATRSAKLSRASLAGAVLFITACVILTAAFTEEEPSWDRPDLSQDPVILRMKHPLSRHLALMGIRLAREAQELFSPSAKSLIPPSTWEDSMHLRIAKIKEQAERENKWEAIRSAMSPILLRASLDFSRAALMADSTNYEMYHLMSYPLNASGDRKGAIAACEKHLELIGDKPNIVLSWLGSLYCQDGQKEKALEVFKKQILLDPTNVEFYVDTKLYMGNCFTPEEIEKVLSLSKVHKGK